MRFIFVAILLFIFSETLVAQNFRKVDSLVKTYPSHFNETKELSSRINNDFQNPNDQVRAIFNWITQNVAYDWGELNQPSYSYSSEEERVVQEARYQDRVSKRVLRKRKAICSGYSYLFKELCDHLKVDCKIVSGYARNQMTDIAKPWTVNHAWNIVSIDGDQHLIDATWGAGHMDGDVFERSVNYAYFYTSPSDFIKNHYPEHYEDSLLEKKISKKEFCFAPFLHNITELRYKLISPKTLGILRSDSNIKFSFQISESISHIDYYLGRERYTIEDYKLEDDALSFTVDLKGKKGRNFDLYIDGNPTVSYLVRK